jgi:hypothetical protein
MKSKYTKEILEPIIKESLSYRQVLFALGLRYTGGNYSNIKQIITNLGLDTAHFTGKAHMLGSRALNRKTPEKYLIVYPTNKSINTNNIKLKLFRDNIREERCEICGNTVWMGDKIPLTIHHINGNRWDNRLENIQILCYNCHARTENFSAKKK